MSLENKLENKSEYNNISEYDSYRETINTQIKLQRERRKTIGHEIDKLKELLKNIQLDEYLLENKLYGPKLLAVNKELGKYRYLTEPLFIDNLNITLYPIWLSLKCVHPKWSQDVMSLNIISYSSDLLGEQEILIDGLYHLFNNYKKTKNFIEYNELTIPIFYPHEYIINSNIIINFNESTLLKSYQFENMNFISWNTSDSQMMVNVIKSKFILII